MNFKEFFRLEEFKEYRRVELTIGLDVMGDLLKGSKTPEYAKGATDMLNRIILAPNSLQGGKQAKQIAEEMTAQDLKVLKAEALKRVIVDNG